jgi:DNA-binding IclR family transcriptional regulator
MKQRTTSVAKALAVLESIGEARSKSLTEISRAVRLPKSTLLRLIGVLVSTGFVRRTAHGEYAVTLKMWRIGCNAINSENVRDEVIPVLRKLVERTGETTHYCVYENGHSIYVEKVDGLHPIRAYTSVGGRSPAYATATGKALLAWRDEAEIAEVARQSERWTDKTHVGVKAILRHAAEIRNTGYAVNRGEWRESVWGIAAPVFDRYGKVIAAVGISGPRERVEPNVEEYAKHVCSAAREVSRRHGALERAS